MNNCPDCGSEDFESIYQHYLNDENLLETCYNCHNCDYTWIDYFEEHDQDPAANDPNGILDN